MGADQFIGAWRLLSFETRRSDGQVIQPLGEKPVGLIMWDPEGNFSAQLMHSNHQPGGDPSQPGNVGYVAYFGYYDVDDERGVLTHHVDGAMNPGMIGVDQERWFRFDGDRLELRPPDREVDGVTSTSVLTWQRINRGGESPSLE